MDQSAFKRPREAILDFVLSDGSNIGIIKLEMTLRERLGSNFSEDGCWGMHARLIDGGILGKRNGRGGSVLLKDDKNSGEGSQAKNPRSKRDSACTGGADKCGTYEHQDETTLGPAVGLQDRPQQLRDPETYCFASSLAPELSWDKSAERELAEGQLCLVAESVEKGEEKAFPEACRWKGTGEELDAHDSCVGMLLIPGLAFDYERLRGGCPNFPFGFPSTGLYEREREANGTGSCCRRKDNIAVSLHKTRRRVYPPGAPQANAAAFPSNSLFRYLLEAVAAKPNYH